MESFGSGGFRLTSRPLDELEDEEEWLNRRCGLAPGCRVKLRLSGDPLVGRSAARVFIISREAMRSSCVLDLARTLWWEDEVEDVEDARTSRARASDGFELVCSSPLPPPPIRM